MWQTRFSIESDVVFCPKYLNCREAELSELLDLAADCWLVTFIRSSLDCEPMFPASFELTWLLVFDEDDEEEELVLLGVEGLLNLRVAVLGGFGGGGGISSPPRMSKSTASAKSSCFFKQDNY